MKIDGDTVWGLTFSFGFGEDRIEALSLNDDNFTFYLSDTDMRRAWHEETRRRYPELRMRSFEEQEQSTAFLAGLDGDSIIEHSWTLPLGNGFDR